MPNSTLKAVIKTNKGDINLSLFDTVAPMTVANFINLSTRGFYDNLNFHRVIADFMVQSGCHLGTGTGGPGYQFNDECTTDLSHDKPGRLSMANAGSGTNGSQFFITHVPTTWLDMKHTIFGDVDSDSDQDIINNISQGDIIATILIEGDYTALQEEQADNLTKWNSILDKKFPQLKATDK